VQYRGHTADELMQMGDEEVMKLITARARRTLKRGLTPEQSTLLERVDEARAKGQKTAIKTHVRDMVILPKMVGLKFGVHNGKGFTEFEATTEMVGRYVSEFTYNRKPVRHGSPGVGATRSSLFVPIK